MRISFEVNFTINLGRDSESDSDTEGIGFKYDSDPEVDDPTPVDDDHPGTWVNKLRRWIKP